MIKKFLLLVVFVASIYFSINSEFFQKKGFAGLQIEYPQGKAAVFIDDQYLGQAPLFEEKLQSGETIIKIVPEKQELASFSVPLNLERNTLTVIIYNPGENPKDSSSLIFELNKLKNTKTALSLESYPEDSMVSIDDGEAQMTPFRIENIAKGDHHFAVDLTSYHSKEHSFQILEGYETKITVNLAKNNNEELTIQTTEETILPESQILESSDSAQISSPKVKINNTGLFVDGEEVLRVRDASASSGQELGFVKTNYFYPYLAEVSSDQNWLKINFQGQEAWISSQCAQVIE